MKKDRRKRPGLRALSITQYALIFLFILFLVTAWLAWATLRETAALKRQTIESQRKAALREVDIANTEITQIAERVAQALTSWDEVRQQLVNPAFYAHWRSSRALSAGKIPILIEAMDLYDKHGIVLAGSAKKGDSVMPRRILSSVRRATLVKEERDYLYYFFPIRADDNPMSALLGYGGIKLDYLSTLQALRPLRYVDVKTISIPGKKGEMLDLGAVVTRAQFKLNRAPEFESIENIMINSLYRMSFIFGIFSVFAYVMITSLVTLPLRHLARRIHALREGQGSLLNDSYRGLLPVSELEQLRLSFNDYQARLEDMHLSLENKNKELWTLAHHDALTGVYNRRAFEEDWNRFTARAAKHSTKMAFLLLDCDRFKAINDTYGHPVGDLVIQGIVQSIRSALRADDRLYRLGGDEFGILLFDTTLENAKRVAERCIDEVNQYDFYSLGVKEPVRISVGLAYWSGSDLDSLFTLHKQADLAMYHAKKPGHEKLTIYSDALFADSQALVSSRDTSAVYEAVSSPAGLLEMHYQKVVRLPETECDYYEALVRIRYRGNLIMPVNIFPVVEARGLEIEFDLAVLKAVRSDLTRNAIPATTGVSINISGTGIVNRNVIEQLMSLTHFMGKYKLVVEVTETALISQINQASTHLIQLRKAGFKVALDDFASGYSSLRYLANMPVDIVKFDISIVRSLQGQDRQATIVRYLATLVREAGYELVAEGIENEEALKNVIDIGFSHAQGYYLARPQTL